jgi:hypothetical protein
MDNLISKIRKQIRALRVSMLEAGAIMREQINRDEECSAAAGEIIVMRTVMSHLVQERARLGDREPIEVDGSIIPRRPYAPPRPAKQVYAKPMKRHLTPGSKRAW